MVCRLLAKPAPGPNTGAFNFKCRAVPSTHLPGLSQTNVPCKSTATVQARALLKGLRDWGVPRPPRHHLCHDDDEDEDGDGEKLMTFLIAHPNRCLPQAKMLFQGWRMLHTHAHTDTCKPVSIFSPSPVFRHPFQGSYRRFPFAPYSQSPPSSTRANRGASGHVNPMDSSCFSRLRQTATSLGLLLFFLTLETVSSLISPRQGSWLGLLPRRSCRK